MLEYSNYLPAHNYGAWEKPNKPCRRKEEENLPGYFPPNACGSFEWWCVVVCSRRRCAWNNELYPTIKYLSSPSASIEKKMLNTVMIHCSSREFHINQTTWCHRPCWHRLWHRSRATKFFIVSVDNFFLNSNVNTINKFQIKIRQEILSPLEKESWYLSLKQAVFLVRSSHMAQKQLTMG